MPAATEARRHLTSIARAPRPAGGEAEAEARRYCADVLSTLGFSVDETPVEYSGFPGRYATPVLGGAVAASIAGASLTAAAGDGTLALVILVGAVASASALGFWLARRGVLSLPLLRERSHNLVARRGTPAVWLVAHLDSKSQPVPIALRAAGLISLGVVWLAAVGLAIAAMSGVAVAPFGAPIAVASGIAGVPVVLSLVGARSPGARDNASGVATVLCAVAELRTNVSVGVVLTSAEELGLAGARVLAASNGAPATAINIDTVDDVGEISVMYTGRPPNNVIGALEAVGRRRHVTLAVRRLVPGILTDGVALADGGWEVVTLSKATMGTLARVHTTSDTAVGMSAAGITEAAALVAEAVGELHARGE